MAILPPEKLRHLAACLPVAGLFLLMPPALFVFGTETSIAGVPLIVLYIFGIWAGLIACAAALARHLDTRDLSNVPTSHRARPDKGESGASAFRPDQRS